MIQHLRSFVAATALLLPSALHAAAVPAPPPAGTPIRVVIVGLVHGHVGGFLQALPNNQSATLVGIVEPDTALARQYATRFHLAPSLFSTDLESTLNQQHPDAVLVYTTIADHRKIIEAAARHGISSMVEKPLSTTMDDALAIQRAAREHHVQVLVNYETTWYSSNAQAIKDANDGTLGTLRKVVVHDGHEGPKEIGVGPEWLPWLTDPKLNGAGALFDFGCYGADLMTVLRHGETPTSVTAVAQTDKPDIYPHVDDDATIIVRYPGAQAVLMPSWTWTFARKDMELYGTNGTVTTVGPDHILTQLKSAPAGTSSYASPPKTPTDTAAPPLSPDQRDSLSYLAAVLHGEVKADGDLSALNTNMVVMQILTAARESAETGRTVTLKPLPQ